VPRFLLDTNILSDFIRNPSGLVASRLDALAADEEVCTSIVVAAELRYGAMKKKSRTLAARIEEVLQTIELLPLSPDADMHYGTLRTELEADGTPIGANDMFIAASAFANGCILVTDNLKEFTRVRGLVVQNWVRPPGRARR
jgi:tRNA(fMet)-specific endonuclease VapC